MIIVTKIYWVPIKYKAWSLELSFVVDCTELKSFHYLINIFFWDHTSSLYAWRELGIYSLEQQELLVV